MTWTDGIVTPGYRSVRETHSGPAGFQSVRAGQKHVELFAPGMPKRLTPEEAIALASELMAAAALIGEQIPAAEVHDSSFGAFVEAGGRTQ